MRFDDDLQTVADPHLAHNGGDVGLDGGVRDIHPARDLVVGPGLAQQAENLLLALGQIQVLRRRHPRGLSLSARCDANGAARRPSQGAEELYKLIIITPIAFYTIKLNIINANANILSIKPVSKI